MQYQTVQGAYGILDREYCVLQQKLYGLQGGYYGVNKNGEVVYDMPYDAVINTSLPVPQEDAVGVAVREFTQNLGTPLSRCSPWTHEDPTHCMRCYQKSTHVIPFEKERGFEEIQPRRLTQ